MLANQLGRGRFGRVPAITFVAVSLALLCGCVGKTGDSNDDRDRSTRARMDFASGEILLPLGEYETYDNWIETTTLDKARQIAMGRCMQGKGHMYSASAANESAETSVGDRQYGLWDERRARKYGYDPGSTAVATALAEDEASGGEPWRAAANECQQSLPAEIKNLLPDGEDATSALVTRISTEAFARATGDPAWQLAREKWWDCLRSEGLQPRTGPSDWNTTQAQELLELEDISSVRSQLTQIAYQEAHCNVLTGMAQTLANIEASYQTPLIAKNQAALNKAKDEKQNRLRFAREYVARN